MRLPCHPSVALFCSLLNLACGDKHSACDGSACASTGGVSSNSGAGGTLTASTTGTSAGGATTGGLGTGGSSNGGVGTGGVGTGGTKTGSGGATTGIGGSPSGGTAGTGGVTAHACPTSSDYVGNAAWPDQLVVTAGAEYCGHFKEIRAPHLEQEYAAKAKLTIAPGTYRLSNTAGTYDFALPVCFERRPGEPVPTIAGAGKVSTTKQTVTSTNFVCHGHSVTQPITVDGAATSFLSMYLAYWTYSGTPQPPVLDGGLLKMGDGGTPERLPGYNTVLELCVGTQCDDQPADVLFEACNPDYPLQRHTVAFDGGQIVLDVRITGQVGAGVMSAAFTNASGTLDGTAFAQTDYWKLTYSADHHHFIRNFAVLFDAPIGGACGLKVLSFIGNNPGEALPEVDTINCDLSNIAARTVTSAKVELP